MIALRTCNWNCNGTKYELVKGQKVDVKSTDLEQAKASGLFDLTTIVATEVRKTKTKK